MRTVLLSCLALGAMTHVALADEPLRLSDTQMDGLTAGAAFVNVEALALALGNVTNTQTNTRAVAVGTGVVDVAVGVGAAQSFACCGEASVAQSSTSAIASGDLVIGHSFNLGTRHFFSTDTSIAIVVGIGLF